MLRDPASAPSASGLAMGPHPRLTRPVGLRETLVKHVPHTFSLLHLRKARYTDVMVSMESQQFRDNLAKKLTDSPDERKQILADEKTKPAYWDARAKTLQERQKPGEEIVDDGKGILIKHKSLYHGTHAPDIKGFSLEDAEFDTIGRGVYLTSEAKDAIGYGRRRSRARGLDPRIYEASINNLKLFDLRKDENVREVMLGFKDHLEGIFLQQRDVLKNAPKDGPEWEFAERFVRQWIRCFSADQRIGKEQVDWNTPEYLDNPLKMLRMLYEYNYFSKSFGEYVASLGYDGIVAIEGGEGNDVRNHDTYLIFDPNKVHINEEQHITD